METVAKFLDAAEVGLDLGDALMTPGVHKFTELLNGDIVAARRALIISHNDSTLSPRG